MGDLDDVLFNSAGAADLAAELRSAASAVDHEAGERNRVGDQAKQEWRGTYRERFDEWLTGCVDEGHRIADELRRAATQLDQAASDARAEQTRREQAREDRPWYEKAWDAVTPG
ncbi:MAG: hypothetical protein ACRDYX_05490 [Egibacteraceae bacterium]